MPTKYVTIGTEYLDGLQSPLIEPYWKVAYRDDDGEITLGFDWVAAGPVIDRLSTGEQAIFALALALDGYGKFSTSLLRQIDWDHRRRFVELLGRYVDSLIR